MIQKQPGEDFFLKKAKKRTTGNRRILVHVILLLLLGVFFLSMGLYGRQALSSTAADARLKKRVDLLHTYGMDQIKTAMLSATKDEVLQKNIRNVFTTQKRSLKKLIAARVELGEENTEILQTVWDHLSNALIANATDAQPLLDGLSSVKEDILNACDQGITKEIHQLSLQKIKLSLPLTHPHYPLIYYNLPLMIFGGILLFLFLFLLYAYLRFNGEQKTRLCSILEPIDYLLPFMIGVFVFTLYPVIRVIIMSFQERFKLDGTFSSWGLANYQYVFKGVPGTTNYFMQGLVNTLKFVLYTVPASTVLAIIIAYLLNQKLRYSAFFQTGYFLPMVTSVTAVGLVWRWIFNFDYGLLNSILSFLNMDKINWLQNSHYSMTVLVIFSIWSSLPFTIILLLSGLQNIDETFYTVARVDGAKAFRIFKRITVPLLAPTIGLVLTINSISAFKVFTEVTVLFNGQPGPTKNMYTMVYYIFETMRGESLEYGRAAAAAIILFVLIFLFTMIQRYIQRKWNYM